MKRGGLVFTVAVLRQTVLPWSDRFNLTIRDTAESRRPYCRSGVAGVWPCVSCGAAAESGPCQIRTPLHGFGFQRSIADSVESAAAYMLASHCSGQWHSPWGFVCGLAMRGKSHAP